MSRSSLRLASATMGEASADRRRRRRAPSSSSSSSPSPSRSAVRLPTTAALFYLLIVVLASACLGGASPPLAAEPAPPASLQPSRVTPIRVAYQGEPGAYSEKSLRELLGPNVVAVGYPNFESCYRAVANREAEYCLLPVENSLGGSIHENYDLMLRYDLTIVAEHEFRVEHCLLAKDGVSREEIQFAISHPQALAQCDNYLRGLGITPIPTYDTAGSAKMIDENKGLPEGCTPKNTAAIASDLAGLTYNMHCLDEGIEDDTSNFTRFLLLGRKGVVQHLSRKIPSKTSIVFTLPNTPGALYKALACFSLRDIDFSKIESRPTSASLLSFLKFRRQVTGGRNSKRRSAQAAAAVVPRFRYCFYLDFLASELDESAQYALSHLREQADFVRILGSYPAKSRLVGPVKEVVEELKRASPGGSLGGGVKTQETSEDRARAEEEESKLSIGVVGYGPFGQFLGRKFAHLGHSVKCLDTSDMSREAARSGAEYYAPYDARNFLRGLDVVVLAVPLVDFEEAVTNLPPDGLSGKLVVDVCPLSVHPKTVLTRHLPQDADILVSHPMFGPTGDGRSGTDADARDASSAQLVPPNEAGWDGQPFVYDRVRTSNAPKRSQAFLRIFERSRCRMVEMTAEQHDAVTADAEFVTHLTGRLLSRDLLPPTPVASKEYAALSDVADLTGGDSFDLFYGMFKYNDRARDHLNTMRENLARVERQLASREAYLTAKAELQEGDRRRLVAECRGLLEEAARQQQQQVGGGDADAGSTEAEKSAPVAEASGVGADDEAKKKTSPSSSGKGPLASSAAFLSKKGKS